MDSASTPIHTQMDTPTHVTGAREDDSTGSESGGGGARAYSLLHPHPREGQLPVCSQLTDTLLQSNLISAEVCGCVHVYKYSQCVSMRIEILALTCMRTFILPQFAGIIKNQALMDAKVNSLLFAHRTAHFHTHAARIKAHAHATAATAAQALATVHTTCGFLVDAKSLSQRVKVWVCEDDTQFREDMRAMLSVAHLYR
jgi:hypothetical protein